jgi:hypothetical protein
LPKTRARLESLKTLDRYYVALPDKSGMSQPTPRCQPWFGADFLERENSEIVDEEAAAAILQDF